MIHLERSILERRDPSSVASRSTWDGMTTKIRLVIFQEIFFAAFVAAILFFLFLFSYFLLPRFPGFSVLCLGESQYFWSSSLMRKKEKEREIP